MNENQNIEFKEIWKDEYLKWICGFANAQGGKVYIGKNDNGTTVGVDNINRLAEDIPNKIKDILGIVVDVNILKENNKEYIEIIVPSYSNPISYKGQYHYRSGRTKQELRGVALNQFILEKTGKNWEDVPVKGVLLDDLSNDAINRFRKEAFKSHRVDEEVLSDSVENLMEDLRLIDKETGQLTRAGILLFYPKPEEYFFGSYIKIGFFRSDNEDLAFQDEVHGPLMLQIDKTLDLIKTKYLIYGITYEGISRRETPQFPVEAIRESLMNAIAHKDYSDPTPIQISVYPDHIVFWNAGKLPENWTTLKLFEKHPSRPRNPLIANTMFRSGDIESWGRGYKRIIDAINAYKLLPPTLEMLSGLMITYYSNVRSQLKAQKVDEKYIPIIEYVVQNGKITNSDVQKLLNTNRTTAYRILHELSDMLQMSSKTGVATYYTLKELG